MVKVGAVRERVNALLQQAGLGREECLARLGRIARVSIVEFYRACEDGHGVVVDWHQVLEGEHRDVIREIRIGAQGVEIRGYDRLRALEWIGKSRGLFVDSVVDEQSLERPISQAALAQALQQLWAYRRANAQVIEGRRERERRAGIAQ